MDALQKLERHDAFLKIPHNISIWWQTSFGRKLDPQNSRYSEKRTKNYLIKFRTATFPSQLPSSNQRPELVIVIQSAHPDVTSSDYFSAVSG